MALIPQSRVDVDDLMYLAGRRIRELRIARGAGRRNLAAAAGLHQNTIERIENGEAPTLRNMVSLARALGTTVGYLLGETSIP